LEVALRLPAPPASVVRQPAGERLPFLMRDGRVVVSLPRLEIHDVLVVE
jgi:hypothetical protein